MNDKAAPIQTRLNTSGAGPLSAVLYRSKANRALQSPELIALVQRAKMYNQAASLTGFILYDEDYFLQWLEGPEAELRRAFDRISRDQRHDDIEILSDGEIPARLFGGWNLMLSSKTVDDRPELTGGVEIDSDLMNAVRHRPEETVSLVRRFGRKWGGRRFLSPSESVQANASNVVETIHQDLESAIVAQILPAITRRHEHESAIDQLPFTGPFSRALLEGRRKRIDLLIEHALAQEPREYRALISLFEATERRFGDLWKGGHCTDLDIVLAEISMAAALRRLFGVASPRADGAAEAPSVLVAPHPGEHHVLRTILSAETLWRAGWAPTRAFPADTRELCATLNDNAFDALILAASGVYRRDHWMPRMADTIAEARAASGNPNIAIIVGGRLFEDDKDAADAIGADARSVSTRCIAEEIRAIIQ
ncbi:MAG: BLUF domain-containing protein [Hyphococcus sp.]